jgi:hypothetical protein
MPKVLELYDRCLIASGTSHSGVAIMEVIVLEPFGNSQFGFLALKLWGSGLMLVIWDGVW